MADEIAVRQDVIVVSFEEDSDAYEALSKLKELDSEGRVDLQSAAVVTRGTSGRVVVKDEVGHESITGAASGGLIGLLIGIIGGPLGVLLGGATGLLVGSLFDLDDDEDSESVLSDISKSVSVGHTSLLAEVSEPGPEVVDETMRRLSGTVLRRSVQDVEAEIAAAEDAQRTAKKEARKALRERRHAEREEKVHAKVAELKGKLHHHAGAGASSA